MLLYVLLLLARTSVNSFDILPGIDNIEAGYDAAKMLSASEQNSKFRIFDFSEQMTSPFNTKVLGKNRIYSVPKLVQVTDISVRQVNSCERVVYTFQSFFDR
jgi:hypothetical protein